MFLIPSGDNIYCGPLAQLVEQLTLNQPVQGSSPWRLILDIELPSDGIRHTTQQRLIDKKPEMNLSLRGPIILASRQ